MISQIKKAVNTAFDRAGDLAETVQLKHQLPKPDQPPPDYETEYEFYTVKIIKTDYTEAEMNLSGGTIEYGDKKVLMPASQLSFRPTVGNDYLIIDGSQYSIKSVRIKAKSLYILRI